MTNQLRQEPLLRILRIGFGLFLRTRTDGNTKMTLITASTLRTVTVLLITLVFGLRPAQGQLNGHNIKGDAGLMSASLPPPGIYFSTLVWDYNTSRINNRNGDKINPDGSLNALMLAPVFTFIPMQKVIGANWGIQAGPAFASTRIEAPRLDFDTGLGVSDSIINPFLGWRTTRADYLLGYRLYIPNGRFEPGADDNTGLGMWTNEFVLGTTLYFDTERTWHLAMTGSYEIHSKTKDQELQVGDIFTIEGGFGRSFFQGAGSAGVAYYGQFKVTSDSGSDFPSLLIRGKNRVHGIGPEINFPITANQKLITILTVRYQWEFAARTTTQGQALTVGLTFQLKMFQPN